MVNLDSDTARAHPDWIMATGGRTPVESRHQQVLNLGIPACYAYIRDAIRTMRTHRLATVEPREDVTSQFNAGLQERMKRTVWTTGGCASWYLDSEGRNTTLWPRATFTFRRLLSRFDLAAYTVTGETSPVTTPSREAVSA